MKEADMADTYFIALVTRDSQWFEGPYADSDEAHRLADLWRDLPERQAAV